MKKLIKMKLIYHYTVISFIILLQLIFPLHCDNNYVWKSMLNVSPEIFEQAFLPNYVNFTNDVLQNDQLSRQCRLSIQFALNGLKTRQFWAVSLFNSWAKFPPSGTLRGTLTDFGDYDQCLNVNIESLKSQYCLVDMAVPMPRPMPVSHNYFHKAKVLPEKEDDYFNVSSESLMYLSNGSIYQHLAEVSSVFYYAYIQIGICWPRNCTKEDINLVMVKNMKKYGLELSKFTCEQKAVKWELNNVQMGALAFLASTCLLAFIAALYDQFYYSKKHGYTNLNFLIWFSPLRNTQKLIMTKCKDDDLRCIHGMRVLTLVLIIMGHSVDWNSLNSFRDTFTIRDKLAEMLLQPLYRGILTVDTFFFLSGLLTSYVTLKYTHGKYEQFNSFMFIILRYLRLTPQLAIFILFTILLPALFDGPIWKRYMSITEQCYTNWFLNLIYMQNIIDIGRICGLHTWYLAADMQLHVISLLPVIFWLKNRKIGIIIIKMIIITTLAVSCIIIYLRKLPPGSVITSHNDFVDENGMPQEYLSFVYKSWTHAYVFFIGFLFGDYIKNNIKILKQITLSTTKKYLLWLTALGSFTFSIYSTVPWLYGHPYDPLWSVIIFPLNLLSWSFGMGLTIWLCVTNNVGIIGQVLCSPIFPPFSRMTYSVYLTHAWIVWITAGSRRDLIDLKVHSVILFFITQVVAAFILGYIFTILFETPIINALDYIKKDRFKVNLGKLEKCKQNEEKDCKLLELKCT